MYATYNDTMDHQYWLIGCNVEKWVNSELKTSEAIKQKIISIDFEQQILRFLRTFSPDASSIQHKSAAGMVIKDHRNGNIFHYQVGRN